MTDSDAARTDLDAIVTALAQLRGTRRPQLGPGGMGPGDRGPGGFGRGPGFAFGGTGDHSEHPHHHPGRGGPHSRFGGGPARMRLLEALVAASGPLSVSEVGDAIGVDQPRASRLIQQGVELGLVRREADPDDARRTRVALTDEGARLARGFRGERREQLTSALADFDDAERAELARLLTKLAGAWPQR